MNYFLQVMLVVAVTIGLAQAQPAAPGATSGNVTFVTGGVGEESAASMAALGKEYNLKLMFAAKDGHYLADVAVTIVDAGNRKILETVSQGPFLFAQMVPGKYQVTATYAGAAQTRSVTVVAGGRRDAVFRWAEQQAD